MKTTKLLLLTLFFLNSGKTIAQRPEWINITNTNHVTAIAEIGEYLWVGTWGGLIRFHEKTGEKVLYNAANSALQSNNISVLATEADSVLWIGTYNGGLTRYDGHNWSTFTTQNSGLVDDRICALAIDEENVKWIGTDYNGLVRFDNATWTTYNPMDFGIEYGEWVRTSRPGQHNLVWRI